MERKQATKGGKRKKAKENEHHDVYRMPPPNDDLFQYATSLSVARRAKEDGRPGAPFWTFHDMPPVPDYAWVDPRSLEHALCHDEALLQQAAKVASRPSETGIARLAAAVTEFFETQYLPRVLREFDAAAPLIAHYLVALQAHRKAGLLDADEAVFQPE